MPGVFPVIGRTPEEAEANKQLLVELIPEEAGISLLSTMISYDLSPYPVDGPLPELPELDQINGGKSRFKLLKDLANREGLTIRQLYQRIAGARGHRGSVALLNKLQINCRNGLKMGQLMDLTLCHLICPGVSMILWIM